MATVVRIRQTWDLTFRRRRGPSDSSKTQSTRMSASASASASSTVLRARAARVKPSSSSSSSARGQFLFPRSDLCPPYSCQFPRKPKSRLWPDDAFGRRRRCFGCKSQLGELAPVTSAVYGSLLLGGGLFAYGRSGSKGSLAGGSTGAVLMGARQHRSAMHLDLDLPFSLHLFSVFAWRLLVNSLQQVLYWVFLSWRWLCSYQLIYKAQYDHSLVLT